MKSDIEAISQRGQALPSGALMPGFAAEMEAAAAEQHIPGSPPEVALFLEITARSINARRALEIGTGIGSGAVTLGRAMPEGSRVTTIEQSEQRVQLAREFIRRAGIEQKTEIIQARALTALPQLKGPFDLAYLAAAREESPQYLELIVPLLRPGGVIIADNVLCKTGKPSVTEQEEAITSFNQRFITHPQLRSVILPFGSGLAYGVRIS
ncbi:MAG TPA: O-methyltransferase [Blastocatellia bacterium]|nr:O-methyltransferase [Blastocatellia bacterium]